VTLGMSFIISDACMMLWGGDSIPVPTQQNLQAPTRLYGLCSDLPPGAGRMRHHGGHRAVCSPGADAARSDDPRRGVDDAQMARAVGIPVSRLFTMVFCLGAGMPVPAACWAAPILSAYPGTGRRHASASADRGYSRRNWKPARRVIGSFIIGLIYTFGTALFPELAYIILFLPMIFVIAFGPRACSGVSVHEVGWRGLDCRIVCFCHLSWRAISTLISPVNPDCGDFRAQP